MSGRPALVRGSSNSSSQVSLEALLLVDDERRYVRVNQAAARLLGAAAEEIVGRRLEDYTPQEHVLRLQRLWSQFRRARKLGGHYEVLQGNGRRLPIQFRAVWDLLPGRHLIAALPASEPARRFPGDRLARLSRREREILELLAGGCSPREIAQKLVLSVPTVRTHLRNAYRKLGVRGSAAAAAAVLAGER